MIQAMYSGVSGLKAFKTQLDVIGNNIANVNTVGFKGSRVTFQEMLSQTLKGGTAPSGNQGGINPMQVGLGVNIGMMDVNQLQGSLQATGKLTDAAIEGNGFFIVSTGSGMLYTRDGTFAVDGDYNLVNSSGMPVLGWIADPITGAVNADAQVTPSSAIRIPIGQMSSARQTSIVRFGGNLNAEAVVGDPDDIKNLTVPIYDSLGISHMIDVTFTKTDSLTNEWQYDITSADGLLAPTTGTITFDSNGKCDTDLIDLSMDLTTANGSLEPIDFQLSFGSITQLAGAYTASPTYQDGLALGTLESFTIGKDGTVSGTFDNGNIRPLGRLALAEFANPAGLMKVGSNLLNQSANSGIPQIGAPDTGSKGKISSGFLESSNVDLSTEFANMIVAQRAFQANSRIITVSDEVLQELTQLKR